MSRQQPTATGPICRMHNRPKMAIGDDPQNARARARSTVLPPATLQLCQQSTINYNGTVSTINLT